MKPGKEEKSRRIRCFVGIAYRPSKEFNKFAQSLAQLNASESSRLRMTADENLHITLKFLGSVEETHLAVIENTLQQIATRHKRLGLGRRGIGKFKNSIWVGAETTPELLALVGELNMAFATLGISQAEEKYVPHITVARHKQLDEGHFAKLKTAFGSELFKEFNAPTITLFRSDTLPKGARYTAISDFKLGKA